MSTKNNAPYTVPVAVVSQGDLLGISPDEIKGIVHTFYSKVRSDALLGPVFEREMQEDWDHHLQKMENFWTTVMFGKPLYKGNPLVAHQNIPSIREEHFSRWLELFAETLEEICANKEHINAFYNRATSMARTMTAAIGLRSEEESCK